MILAAYRKRRNFFTAVPLRNVHHQGAIAHRSLCHLELHAGQWRERERESNGGRAISGDGGQQREEGREGELRRERDLRSRRRRRRAAERRGARGRAEAGEMSLEPSQEGGRGRARDRGGRREMRRSSPETEGNKEERGERESRGGREISRAVAGDGGRQRGEGREGELGRERGGRQRGEGREGEPGRERGLRSRRRRRRAGAGGRERESERSGREKGDASVVAGDGGQQRGEGREGELGRERDLRSCRRRRRAADRDLTHGEKEKAAQTEIGEEAKGEEERRGEESTSPLGNVGGRERERKNFGGLRAN